MIPPPELASCSLVMWDRADAPLSVFAAWIEGTSFTRPTIGTNLRDTKALAPGGWWAQPVHFVLGPRWLVETVVDAVAVDGIEHLIVTVDSEGVADRDMVLGVSYVETPGPDQPQLTEGELTT